MGSAGSKYFTLSSPPECLTKRVIIHYLHTDNFAANKSLESGSSKPELQRKAVKKNKNSFSCLQMKNINFKISRISPESNGEIDRVWWQDSKNLPSKI